MWPDGQITFFKFTICKSKKIAIKAAQIRFKNLLNTNLPSKFCHRLLKFCQRGGISPNLVTLSQTFLAKYNEAGQWLWPSWQSGHFWHQRFHGSKPTIVKVFTVNLFTVNCSRDVNKTKKRPWMGPLPKMITELKIWDLMSQTWQSPVRECSLDRDKLSTINLKRRLKISLMSS